MSRGLKEIFFLNHFTFGNLREDDHTGLTKITQQALLDTILLHGGSICQSAGLLLKQV